MQVIIGTPDNGTVLKEALKEKFADGERTNALMDLSVLDIIYLKLSPQAGRVIAEGRADRDVLVCGAGIGAAIAASRVPEIRAAATRDLLTAWGSVENYDTQILCMGQNVIVASAAWVLVDIWFNLCHDPASNYGPRLGGISARGTRY